MMKFIFGIQRNIKVFYKVIVSLLVYLIRLAQIIQNNKFATSLQYLKEDSKNEADIFVKWMLSF